MTTLEMQEAQTVPEQVPTQPVDTTAPAPEREPDPFDLEHQEALAALAAEQRGQTPAPAPAGTAPPQQPQPRPEPEAPAPSAPQPHMIPKQRLDEVLVAARNLEAQNAFLQGQIAALQSRQAPPPAEQPAEAPAPSPQAPASIKDLMAQVQAERIALAEQYDRSEISLKEFTAKTNQLDATLITAVASQTTQAPQRPDGFERHLYETALDEIEATNPWNVVFAHQDPTLVESLQNQATVLLQQRQVSRDRPDYQAQHARVTAYLMEQQGPLLTGFTPQQADQYARRESGGLYRGRAAPAAGGSPAGGPAQPGTQAPPLSPQAQARQNKLDLAARMPPNLGNGVSAPAQQAVTAADIARMTEAELDALPQSVRAKFMPY